MGNNEKIEVRSLAVHMEQQHNTVFWVEEEEMRWVGQQENEEWVSIKNRTKKMSNIYKTAIARYGSCVKFVMLVPLNILVMLILLSRNLI